MIKIINKYFHHFFSSKIRYVLNDFKLKHRYIILDKPRNQKEYEQNPEYSILLEELSIQRTTYWRRVAWNNYLKMPPSNDAESWDDCHYISREKTLSNQGIRYILDQYRQEKSERRETFIKWGTFILAGIAALGTVLKVIG